MAEQADQQEVEPQLSGVAAIRAKFSGKATSTTPQTFGRTADHIKEELRGRRHSVKDMANKFKDGKPVIGEEHEESSIDVAKRSTELINELLSIDRTSVKDIAGAFKGIYNDYFFI